MIENMHQGRERRRFPRFAANFGVRMIDVELKRIHTFSSEDPYYETHFVATDAVGTNISEGGFAFESNRKPDACNVLGLEIFLPEEEERCGPAPTPSPHCGGTGFRALGEVVWVTSSENGYLVGLRFIDLSPRRSAALQGLIAARNARLQPSDPIRTRNRDSLAQS